VGPKLILTRVAAVLAIGLGTGLAAAQDMVPVTAVGGQVIAGYVFRPAGTGPFPAVVGMHGCSGLTRDDGMRLSFRVWAELLAANGYVVLMLDSFRPRGFLGECDPRNARISRDLVRPRDAYGGLLWLQGRSWVKPDRIALIGWSHGGGSALYALGGGSPVDAADLPRGGFAAAVLFYPSPCNQASHGSRYRPAVPLLVLLGANDMSVPSSPCESLVDRIRANGGRAEAVTYQQARHGFDMTAAEPAEGEDRPARGTAPRAAIHQPSRADAQARVLAFLARTLADR